MFFKKDYKKFLYKDFILSKKYENIMLKYFDPDLDGINSANIKTKNFRFRHFKKNRILGCWRWLGLFQNRYELADIFFSKDLKGLDFGGGRGPISLNVEICDRLNLDLFERQIKYNDLNQIENNTLDFIWSSHTVEHINNIENIIILMKKKIIKKGFLILHLPSYSCKRWRSGVHKYSDSKGESNHIYTFYLSKEIRDVEEIKNSNYVEIDRYLSKFFKIEKAENIGDNSILIIGKNI